MDWWKGLQAFQLVMAGAFIYLVWWTFDRYHRSNLKAIQGAKADTQKSIETLSKAITELTTRYDNHVKEQLADQTAFSKKLGELENADAGLEHAILGRRDDLSISIGKIESRLSALEKS